MLTDLKSFIGQMDFIPFSRKEDLFGRVEILSKSSGGQEQLIKLLDSWENIFSADILKSKIAKLKAEIRTGKIICEAMGEINE